MKNKFLRVSLKEANNEYFEGGLTEKETAEFAKAARVEHISSLMCSIEHNSEDHEYGVIWQIFGKRGKEFIRVGHEDSGKVVVVVSEPGYACGRAMAMLADDGIVATLGEHEGFPSSHIPDSASYKFDGPIEELTYLIADYIAFRLIFLED